MTSKPEFTVRQFDRALHDRSAFSCGVAQIDNWLKNSVSDLIRINRLRLWCATDASGRLAGFYALNSHSIEIPTAAALAHKRDRVSIPVIYLHVIAVAKDLQGSGLGQGLMGHAIRKAVNISEEIAIAAIVLDVHNDEEFSRRLVFYQRLGFKPLGSKPERVFLSIKDAKASL